jgi:hypothetical protein
VRIAPWSTACWIASRFAGRVGLDRDSVLELAQAERSVRDLVRFDRGAGVRRAALSGDEFTVE